MRLKIFIFGLIFILSANSVLAASGLRCDEIEDENYWTAIVLDDWEKGVEEFQEEMDFAFQIKLAELEESAASFECQSSAVVFKITDFGNFSEMVLKETRAIECALLQEYRQLDAYSLQDVAHSTIYNNQYRKQQEIAQSMENISITTRLALESLGYQQFNFAIHKRLNCVITNLEKMRDGLQDFAEQAVRIPAKFINCGYQK